ncbi:hypothetical protein NPIL_224911 [Nephila pilipes]|uniref:Uncharacterized protein n=1 Tax=Nephila pilipes TaxID=299642 RepID=A0A8X6P411_NEPPI|nr:hypothetical protein NPIL_224911 [Nephila pilipes]
MNRNLWKCCGKPFTEFLQYTDHILFDHDKNADCKRIDSTNRNDRTTLDESQDSCSKQIKIPKKKQHERMNTRKMSQLWIPLENRMIPIENLRNLQRVNARRTSHL